jgi:uncharacterized membrane protein (Fun14 family)
MEQTKAAAGLKELWAKLDIQAWLAKMGIKQSLPIYAGICFGVGFAIGFLFKKYFKLLIFMAISSALLLKFFEYHHIISVDWVAFKAFLGFHPQSTARSIVNSSFEWVKDNVVICLSSLIGFIIGSKLG